jgi:hypothetical protein
MVYFQTKNPNLGKFWRALEWKRLVYSSYFILKILRPLGIHFMAIWSFGGIWVYFPPLWYIVSRKIWQPWSTGELRLAIENFVGDKKFFIFGQPAFHCLPT